MPSYLKHTHNRRTAASPDLCLLPYANAQIERSADGCDKKFNTFGHLGDHFALTRNASDPVHADLHACADCALVFISKDALEEHELTKHIPVAASKDLPQQDGRCFRDCSDRIYHTVPAFERHLRIHRLGSPQQRIEELRTRLPNTYLDVVLEPVEQAPFPAFDGFPPPEDDILWPTEYDPFNPEAVAEPLSINHELPLTVAQPLTTKSTPSPTVAQPPTSIAAIAPPHIATFASVVAKLPVTTLQPRHATLRSECHDFWPLQERGQASDDDAMHDLRSLLVVNRRSAFAGLDARVCHRTSSCSSKQANASSHHKTGPSNILSLQIVEMIRFAIRRKSLHSIALAFNMGSTFAVDFGNARERFSSPLRSYVVANIRPLLAL